MDATMTGVVKDGTAKFRETPLPKAAATVYYPLTDDEDWELAAGVRSTPPLSEGWPQGMAERHAGIGYEVVQALDAPVLHVGEEADNHGFFHALLVHQEQMIVQDIPEVPVPSSVARAAQAMDVEQVLDVPVLHAYDDYFNISPVQQLLVQEIPEAQVGQDPRCGRRQQRRRNPDQVIVQEIPESPALVIPQKRVVRSENRYCAKQVKVQDIPEVQILEKPT